MPFLIGPMAKRLPSNKQLTEHNEILPFSPEVISLPLTTGSQEGSALVKEGDYVRRGQMVALKDDRFYVPFYSPVSGTVKGFAKKMSARLKPCEHLLIENDFKDDTVYLEHVPEENAGKEEIIAFMKEIGLLGQGGAGFPAYIKFNTDKCEHLLINAVECEPYLTADVRNIETNPQDFVMGVKLLYTASGAKDVMIGVKKFHKELIAQLKKLFADLPYVRICPLPDRYPMGWERTLVYEILKKRYEKLPIEAGAIVANATTAITLAMTMRTRIPLFERIVTVSGDNVAVPHNVLCRLGTSVHDLLELCGGVKQSPANLVMGGPMMGTSVTKDEVCINPITNGVSVFADEPLQSNACLRCGRCVEYCPSSLQPCMLNEANRLMDVDRLERLHVMDCVECGTCTYVCPSKIAVTDGVRKAKNLYVLRRKK